MKTIFDLCTPREDVRTGSTKDSDFAADLAQVLITLQHGLPGTRSTSRRLIEDSKGRIALNP